MKDLRTLVAVALLAAIAISAAGQGSSAAATCATTLPAGSDIQAAIDAASPGDVICLQPGIYSPSAKISIDKSISLQGPQAGIDPRPSGGTTRTPGDTSTEAIIDGSAAGLSGIIVIKADNVILDGLEVRNGSGDLIDSESSIPTTGTILRYNVIRNASGDEGVQLRNVQNGVIEYNHVFDVAQDGINMCCGSTGGYIQHNEVHRNSSENAAIYVYRSEQMTVQCNLVYDVFDNDGIKLGSKGGGDASLRGGSVLYNTVHNTAQDGISVYMSGVLVEGNEIYNSTSENGAIYVAWGVSDITIQYNDVHDNALDTRKWGDPGGIMIGTAVDASTVHVNRNNIHGNLPNGVTNKASAELDAMNNWWGAADGPGGAGGGSGDAVSTNVDFASWLTEPQVIVSPCIPEIEVTIDIRPRRIELDDDDDDDDDECDDDSRLRVAILTTSEFDARTVDPSTVALGDPELSGTATPFRRRVRDVDRDGDRDLLLFFSLCDLVGNDALDGDSTELSLTGQTFDGVDVTGSDSVLVLLDDDDDDDGDDDD